MCGPDTMTRITSDRPTGDFWKFLYKVDDSLYVYRVLPNTADDSISANLPSVKCIDLVKPEGSTDVPIYLHSNSNNMPAQDGYSVKPVQRGIDIREVSNPYILTNYNGHFYIPIFPKSLLYDLVGFIRNMTGYAGIRVVPYHEQHSLSLLAGDTNKKLREIRKPVVQYVTEYVGEKAVRKRIEKDHPKKGGEFDRHGNEMVEKMHEYDSLGICSVYLFAGPEDDAFVRAHSYNSTIKALDRLQFIPVKPVKKKAGWFKRVEVSPMEIIGTPLFFDVGQVIKKCKERYFSDSIIRHRTHSPLICVQSDLKFPFSHPLVAKTVPTRRIADKVNEEGMFGDSAEMGSGDVVDEDFFDRSGAAS